MKRALFIIIIGVLLLMLFWLSVAGYDIELSLDAPLYQDHLNIPFEDRKVSANINRGEVLSVYGCFDNKTDFYFYVMRPNGVYGYLYELKYKAVKNWVPRMAKVDYFFREPLANIQCLIMVPELSH
ncbi:hypothetical protein [Sulfurirhabdus autotrophica]|uniref:SH3 domain-containing protein n=1 Tax=Sulfurirhabdus autotrophica TaxID=1706046 RepID=A0A4R3XPF6_9PROT|nr:hypothetical protein [Sulfurirhabdus autotrophica]TCV78153.1 hypothetical protein EDC63_1457 [Sulfurirhabdus autotrophica]